MPVNCGDLETNVLQEELLTSLTRLRSLARKGTDKTGLLCPGRMGEEIWCELRRRRALLHIESHEGDPESSRQWQLRLWH
ncbi:unnamed protein product, partial [Effrenium voratum]